MLLDVGRRFYVRIELYVSMYLVFYACLSGVFLAWFFGFISNEFTLPFQVVVVFEILNFLILLFLIILYGAKINEITN